MLLLGFLSLNSDGAMAASPGAAGQKVFDQGEYDKAADLFLEAEIEEPNSAQHIYNKGVADYKAGHFGAAAEAFERAAKKAEGPLKEQSMFNLGNARAMDGDLKNAVKAFEDTLELRPEHQQANENLQYVKKLIEQQPPPQKGEGKSEEKDADSEPSEESQETEPQSEDGENQNEGDQEAEGAKPEQAQPNESEEGQDQAAGENSEPQAGESQQGKASDESKEQGENDQQQAEQVDSGEPEEEPSATPGDETADEDRAQGQEPDKRQSGEAPEMTPEEAERVLRSVQTYSQRYLYRPPQRQGVSRPEKDW